MLHTLIAVPVIFSTLLFSPSGLSAAERSNTQGDSFATLASKIAAGIPAQKETAATLWPFSVAEEELQAVAVIFEDKLLGELTAIRSKPPVQWVSRRYTELALQEIANSRRALFNPETCPEVGKFVAARYGVRGRLVISAGPASGGLQLRLEATIVDIESAMSVQNGGINCKIVVTGALAREMKRSIGFGLKRFTPFDEVDRLILTGKVRAKMRDADRAYDFSRNDEALRLYREAEEMARAAGLTREHASIFYRLGNLHQLKKMTDAALRYYARALELDSAHHLACNNTGKVFLDRENYPEAIKHYSRALEIRPAFAISRYNRGLAVLKSGARDKAALRQSLEDFVAAGEAGPSGFAVGRHVEGVKKVAEAYYYAGVLQHMFGDDENAVDSFRKAVENDATHASAHHELMALAYWGRPRDCKTVIKHGQAYIKSANGPRLRRAAEKAMRDCRSKATENREQEKSLNEVVRRIRLEYGPEYAAKFKELMSLWSSRAYAGKLEEGIVNKVEMSVVKLPEGDGKPVPVRPGDKLRSGTDRYKVTFGTNFECWVYIWQVDSTGKVCPIFPYTDSDLPGGELPTNPVARRGEVRIPSGRWWFRLDENVGIENVIFLVSDKARADVDELLQYFNERAYGHHAVKGRRCDVGVDALIQSENWIIRAGSTLPWELRRNAGIFARGIDGMVEDMGQNTGVMRPDGETVTFHPVVFTANETELAGYFPFRHVAR